MLLDLWGLFRRVAAVGKRRDDQVVVKVDGTRKVLTLAELEDLIASLEVKEERRLTRIYRKGKAAVKKVELVEAPAEIKAQVVEVIREANDTFSEIARKVQQQIEEEEALITILGAI